MSPLVSKRMSASGVASAPTVSPTVSLPCAAGASGAPFRSPAYQSPTAPAATSGRVHSSQGVEALIAQACARLEAALLGQALTPLFPQDCSWTAVADVPDKIARHEAHSLDAVTAAVVDYRDGLTKTAGHLGGWLDASEEDIRTLALQFAKLDLSDIPDLSAPGVREALVRLPTVTEFPGMSALLSRPVLPQSPLARKLLWAESLLGGPVPGQSEQAQFARLSDARFWRRAIRVILMREREHFFLRLRLVGKGAEAYVSDTQLGTRLAQLKRQAQWMKDTVLVPRYLFPGDASPDKLLTLEKVASSPKTRFAKLYAFVKAMDAISIEQSLSTAMLTLTLEPQWHPNPSHGTNSWNGASPRDAHRSMATRWQAVLRDLDRLGVGLSGLRVVEPHKDGCPHWHLWLLYRPEVEHMILCTVMKYFPNKLKVRNPKPKHGRLLVTDTMYESLDALRARSSRLPTHPKEGAQVELARIDRSISSGASYAMKYLLKTVDGGDKLNEQCGLFPDQRNAALQEKRQAHRTAAKRVDAYRSLWGINAAQLFGVAKCLTAWDELRRLNQPPEHAHLRRLWTLARGSEKEGRLAGLGQRGDAKGFLNALGGLAACKGKRKSGKNQAVRQELGRLTEAGINSYGEDIDRTKGLALMERHRVKVIAGERVSSKTGCITPKTVWRTVKVLVASVKTRLGDWSLVPKKHQVQAIAQAEQRFMEQPDTPAPEPPTRLWPSLSEALSALGLLPAPSPRPVDA